MTIGSCALRPDLFQSGNASVNTSPRFNSSQSGEPLRSSDAPLVIVFTGEEALSPSLLSEPLELLTKICRVSLLGVIFVQPCASRLTDIIRRDSIGSMACAKARRVVLLRMEWIRRGRRIDTETSGC